MAKLEQLAALSARVVPLRVYATQDPAVTTEVAKVVKDSDAEVLAEAYNAFPDLVEALRLVTEQAAREANGKTTTTLSAWRKRAKALAAKYR